MKGLAWIAGSAIAVASMAAVAGGDLDNARVSVSTNDRTIYVDGVIGPEFEPQLREAIARYPAYKRVVIRSPGGLRAPAMRMGELFNKRRMTMRVEGRCASACVLMFATAASREMTADSRIGLHRSSLAHDLPIPDALRAELMERNDRETDDVLRRGGFSDRVIALGASTPASTMTWFTAGELKNEGLAFTLLDPRAPRSRAVASAAAGDGDVASPN